MSKHSPGFPIMVAATDGTFTMLITTLYLAFYSIALLVLVSLGLAVIFGMMKVINLAHGEFMMLGAYVCVLCVQANAPFWLACIVAAILVGLFGIVVERLIIQRLYGRMIDTLLATWGLSLLLTGAVTTLMGARAYGLPVSFESVSLGDSNLSTFNLMVIIVAAVVTVSTFALARFTSAGLIVRGTMQDPTVASALGVNKNLVYMGTFGFGSALAGLAGAVIAPLTGATPSLGSFFVAKTFINVIVGGPLPLAGTSLASILFGSVDGIVSYQWSSIAGEVSVLVVAIVLLRLMPVGITGRFRRGI